MVKSCHECKIDEALDSLKELWYVSLRAKCILVKLTA